MDSGFLSPSEKLFALSESKNKLSTPENENLSLFLFRIYLCYDYILTKRLSKNGIQIYSSLKIRIGYIITTLHGA